MLGKVEPTSLSLVSNQDGSEENQEQTPPPALTSNPKGTSQGPMFEFQKN